MKLRLALAAVCAIASPAHSLTIVPTFDSSITGDPNGAAMMAGINYAISVMQSNITDDVTVRITFVADEGIGLGQSLTYGAEFPYSDFISALRSRAASFNDGLALSKLPDSATDPVIGGTQIHLTTAQARLLGLDSYSGEDSTISLKMSLMNFTRPPADSGKYDLAQVAEHEMDEVLGVSSGLPDTSFVWPMDLFRYTTNLARTFTTSGDDAYFSVDGTNLLARFNMHAGGDYADWWSYSGNWAPPGEKAHPQVQDAYSGPGNALDLGPNELAMLDVVGWTLATPPVPFLLTITRTSPDHYTLSWPSNYTGYALQETTDLLDPSSWVDSGTAFSNPATVVSTDAQKFYRLYLPPSSIVSRVRTQTAKPITHDVVKRSLLPRKP